MRHDLNDAPFLNVMIISYYFHPPPTQESEENLKCAEFLGLFLKLDLVTNM